MGLPRLEPSRARPDVTPLEGLTPGLRSRMLRVVAAVVFAGWAASHLRLLDRVIGLELPEWLKPAGMALLLVAGVVVLLCGGMLSTPGILPTKFVVLVPSAMCETRCILGGDNDARVGALS
jgi:hypothetical protein